MEFPFTYCHAIVRLGHSPKPVSESYGHYTLDRVTSGYGPASDVIHEALRFMETHEDWIHELKLAHLREQLKVGVDQLDRGDGIEIGSKSALQQCV